MLSILRLELLQLPEFLLDVHLLRLPRVLDWLLVDGVLYDLQGLFEQRLLPHLLGSRGPVGSECGFRTLG